MSREYFDLMIVVPLEEELQELMNVFSGVEEKSTELAFRHTIETGTDDLSAIVVQQTAMGKAAAYEAVSSALETFDVGLVVCVGIAGALSKDLQLCDVCYSETILDVHENTKAIDLSEGDLDLEFSPSYYSTPRELIFALNRIRTAPMLRASYETWQSNQLTFAKTLISGPLPGRQGKSEALRPVKTLNGVIACGAVSKSKSYNDKLKQLNRKLLAIETESGGVFAAAALKQIPALTVRGISDYADAGKTFLEDETGGAVRKIAAANVATFLQLQFKNTAFCDQVRKLRANKSVSSTPVAPTSTSPTSILETLLATVGNDVDANLRELSPEYKLQPSGYRLPLPRILWSTSKFGVDDADEPEPIDIRDALQKPADIIIKLKRSYPDRSLPWVIANDLLTAEVSGRQVIPIVLNGENIKPPRSGIQSLCPHVDIPTLLSDTSYQLVFVVEATPFYSQSRINFLIDQIKALTGSRFVFLSGTESNVAIESDFAKLLSCETYGICDISFREIAHFVQKNFKMTGSEAEVVALRLRDTFHKFELEAHPTYFAGIEKSVLNRILEANRRADLIQLAVDGFLTFVVADDRSDVNLSRRTRSRYLRNLAVELNVEKRSFSQAELVTFTQKFAAEYDFAIDPIAFIRSFSDKGILHFESDRVQFSLPFIEAYLLASALNDDPTLAIKYFQFDDTFDFASFDLYAEIGASDEIVQSIEGQIDNALGNISIPEGEEHILLSANLHPAILKKHERIQSLTRDLKSAEEEVRSGRDGSEKKQKILDAAEKIRKAAERKFQSDADENSVDTDKTDQTPAHEENLQLETACQIWGIGAVLLGSGAEHLNAETKQRLSGNLIKLASSVLHRLTKDRSKINFPELKKELSNKESLERFAQIKGTTNLGETEEFISNIVDIVEFAITSDPFRRVVDFLCEQARQRVLATSVVKAKVDGKIEHILKATWLADIDSRKGKNRSFRRNTSASDGTISAHQSSYSFPHTSLLEPLETRRQIEFA